MSFPLNADIHLHITMKPFFHGYPHTTKTIADIIEHPKPSTGAGKVYAMATRYVASRSQASVGQMQKGKVRLAWAVLHPMEKEFFNMSPVARVWTRKKGRKDMMLVAAANTVEAYDHLKNEWDYFNILRKEYHYLCTEVEKEKRVSLIKDRSAWEQLPQKEDVIGLAVSIEGGHSLQDADMSRGKLPGTEFIRRLESHIHEIKQWEYAPVCMNLCHHFHNRLSGHAQSLNGIERFILLDQTYGKDHGIWPAGWKAIHTLLDDQSGARILVDTKHMSMRARQEYYRYLACSKPGIPIICSHTGMNGYNTMEQSLRKRDRNRKSKRSDLCRLSMNLSDEEIRIIYNSGGLIGLMMDKFRMGGYRMAPPGRAVTADTSVKIFVSNMLQVIHAVQKPSAWDTVCLGSDFDGAISHFDGFDGCHTVPGFRQQVLEYLETHKPSQHLWYGLSAEEITGKVFGRNVWEFMVRHAR